MYRRPQRRWAAAPPDRRAVERGEERRTFGGPAVTYYGETRTFAMSLSVTSLLVRGAVYWLVTVVVEFIVWSVARAGPPAPSGRQRLAAVPLANALTYALLMFLLLGLDWQEKATPLGPPLVRGEAPPSFTRRGSGGGSS